MFYARTLSSVGIAEIKVGHYCVDFIDHEYAYGTYPQ